jgi:hypothetical protein
MRDVCFAKKEEGLMKAYYPGSFLLAAVCQTFSP